MRKRLEDGAIGLIALLSVMGMVISCLSSCKTREVVVKETEYVDRVVEKRDTLVVEKREREVIHEFDSIAVIERNDTIWETRWRFRDRDRLVVDSTYVSRCDSLQRVIDREKSKEEKVVVKDPVQWWCGAWLLVVGVGFILIRFRKYLLCS